YTQASGLGYAVTRFNSPASFNGNYVDSTTPYAGPFSLVWIRASDNGTIRTVSISNDGATWTQIASHSRTDFMTADEVGIFVNVNNTSNGAIGSFVHWLQN